MKAAVELNSDTWMMACGLALASAATAASTLSLLTGTNAEPTSGCNFCSASAAVTAAKPARPMASSSASTAMRFWPSVAQCLTILKASSAMLGRTWNTLVCLSSRSVSEAAKGAKKRAPSFSATPAPASLLAVPTKPNSRSAPSARSLVALAAALAGA